MPVFIRFIRGFTAIIMSVLCLISWPFAGNFMADNAPLEEDCKLYFAAISDIHMTKETARRDMLRFALQDMQQADRRLDALVLAGDLTDHGYQQEWEMLSEAFSGYDPADRILLAQGNHDTWTEDEGYNLAEKYFREYAEKIGGRYINHEYYSTLVKSYTFIFLASQTDRTAAYISNAQLKWLKLRMSQAAERGGPIFVVCHWPINQTHGLPVTWGEDDMEPDDGGIGEQSAKVEEILKQYDNVFMISGHIHNGFSNEKDSKRTGYVSVESDGSFHSINLPSYMYMVPRGRVANGTGFNLEVYDDEVIIRGRSFSSGVWYTDYVWNIDLV